MKELPKVYEPQQVEGRIYRMWMDNDCFKATPDPDKKPFSIVMPPPSLSRTIRFPVRFPRCRGPFGEPPEPSNLRCRPLRR